MSVMRVVVTLITVLFAATVVCAQTPTLPQRGPDFQVVKYSWSKDRIYWNKESFRQADRDFSDARSRRGSILEEREAREQKARQEKPAEPPRTPLTIKSLS